MVVLLETGEYVYIDKDDIISFNPVENYIEVKQVIIFIFKIVFPKKVYVLSSWMEDNKNNLMNIINKGD